jgi:putative tryptophan/tyrosine transport system substrate-binding protein
MSRAAAFLLAMVVGAIVTGTPLPSVAQEAGRVFRIGILSPAARPDTAIFEAFRRGLADLGYIDGQNIRIEYRLAAGDSSRLPAMAGELVRLPVDIIVADGGGVGTQIAHDATRTIPIVGGVGPDQLAAGLVTSFSHPGGNVTGFSAFGVELSAKRVQLLKEASPAISHLAALWNPAGSTLVRRATEEAARTLGVELHTIEVATPDQIPTGFEKAAAGGAKALVVLPDAMFWNERARIVALAAKHRMPAIYPEREYADEGGLLVYGANIPNQWRRRATYVDKILKGVKPGDLPIEQPTKFDMVVNLKTAEALGLTVPPSILDLADEVIE